MKDVMLVPRNRLVCPLLVSWASVVEMHMVSHGTVQEYEQHCVMMSVHLTVRAPDRPWLRAAQTDTTARKERLQASYTHGVGGGCATDDRGLWALDTSRRHQ